MFIGRSGSNSGAFHIMCRSKSNPFLLCVRMYKEVVLLYGNILTLQYLRFSCFLSLSHDVNRAKHKAVNHYVNVDSAF